MIVYRAVCSVTGKSYIGQTQTGLEERKRQHNKSNKNLPFYNAIRLYGKDSFEWSVLWTGCNQVDCDTVEINLIQFYNSLSPNGYNLKSGGNGGGTHSLETKQKMSDLKVGKSTWCKGLTKETDSRVEQRAESQRGIFKSEEHRVKLRIAKLGKPAQWTSERNKWYSGENSFSALTFLITKPSGEIIKITSLATFCKANELNRHCMRRVAQGIQEHHKGYRCSYV